MMQSFVRRVSKFVQSDPKTRKPRFEARLRLEELEGRWVPSTCSPQTLLVDSTGGHNANYTSIQAAINAASPGTRIEVYGGTYAEQLNVGPGLNNVSIFQVGFSPVYLEAPTTLNPNTPAAVVEISGSQDVYISGLTIIGNSSTQFGIRVDDGATAIIQDNSISNIMAPDGAGIMVGRDEPGDVTTGSAYIINNCVSDYSTTGIVVDNANSYALISCNTVTGLGPQPDILQYGIQVSRGGQADVRGNCVTGNVNTGDSGLESAGILVEYNASPCTNVNNNNLYGNEDGIFLQETASVSVENNYSHNNTADGITVVDTRCSEIDGNELTCNGRDGVGVYGGDPYYDSYANIYVPTGGNNDIYWNYSSDNSQDGFYMDYSYTSSPTGVNANNAIAYNISVNNGGNGFNFVFANQNLIWQNYAAGNQMSGIALTENSDNNLIFANDSDCNVVYGFGFVDASSNNLVIRDSADYNGSYGFYESSDSSNTFVGNTAYGNGFNGRLNFSANIVNTNPCGYQTFCLSAGINSDCSSDLSLFGLYY